MIVLCFFSISRCSVAFAASESYGFWVQGFKTIQKSCQGLESPVLRQALGMTKTQRGPQYKFSAWSVYVGFLCSRSVRRVLVAPRRLRKSHGKHDQALHCLFVTATACDFVA